MYGNPTSASTLRRIAVEEAFVTAGIVAEWKKVLGSRFVEPGFRMMGSTILGDSPGNLLLHQRLLDIGAGRIAQMDDTGISMQVLSLTSPGVQVFDAITARALAAEANDQLAAAVRAHPDRLAGLAAVAPQHPQSAAQEIERAMQRLKLHGVIINSHTLGQYLDDEQYWPILEACAALDAPLYLHPREPAPSMVGPYLDYGLYFAGWGFAAETGLHAMRLIMSGVFDRFPRLRIVLGHMGEGIPFWLKRIDNRYQLQVKIGAVKPLPKLPSDYFRENFVITNSGVTDHAVLRFCLEVLGAERILFAADYPYEAVEPAVTALDEAPLSWDVLNAIYSENAVKVFKLAAGPALMR